MRFTPEELEAARDRLVPDVAASGLRVLFCGFMPVVIEKWALARRQAAATPAL